MKSITEIAKEWIGTPWVHNQSVKGIGTDCVGLILGIGKEYGVIPDNFYLPNYDRIPRQNNIIEFLNQQNYLKPINTVEPEAVMVFQVGKIAGHVGIAIGENQIIHADMNYGVQLVPINFYLNKIAAIYEVIHG